PYTEQDATLFFGREAATDLIVANLLASRLTVLYGPSGVGKSYAPRAGVMSRLQQLGDQTFNFLAIERGLAVYHASWRDQPLLALGGALKQAAYPTANARRDAGNPTPMSVEVLDQVTRDLDCDIFLLLDQFEAFSLYQRGPGGDDVARELGR